MPASMPPRPRAIVFDAYGTLFDVHAVIAAAEQRFTGYGEALSQLWRAKQIEYTQLRTLAAPDGSHYRPFWDITLDALRHACARLGLPLDDATQKRLMDEYACLSAYPDVLPALDQLRTHLGPDVGLGILSNGNPHMLDVAIKSAGMADRFDAVLSVDTVRAYKPSPRAYALGPQAFGCDARAIVFVSSNGWDVAGAGWFGYTTFWLNRAHAPAEELGIAAQGTGDGMPALIAFVDALAKQGIAHRRRSGDKLRRPGGTQAPDS
ncbi:haloacid dehalogenase type II [Trinickia caryophylli]|uniref:(S)-2-haloacid dehalogenase n=1 Tax=Trinickia caryophylli TaxID=28094 RepID=A0A1X7DIY8_TRICW|nr:haloacid dehalogenase type II [Trinickia caryophylli]PMS12275.1 haloacid dehalogenase type II [Trinickia caryophylli]TRX17055.1 haloacid dehalogenase type II [Trinickia caryophylli]WQE12211.1 haloacid dehalogenase type II [Trinickia caryophylli]SMF16308.1 2-haloacid dehalogenase [Trinickia caryophylli]GLU31654.1 haloacid dehalogenase [Trinickia caryophylli]